MPSREEDNRAMEFIRNSGVLNPQVTLSKVMELAQKVATSQTGDEGTTERIDTCIFRAFIYRSES